MSFLPIALAALAASHPASPAKHTAGGSVPSPAHAPRSDAAAAQTRSPKWNAVRHGDFETAARLPAKDAQEGLYLEASAHLARFELDAAAALHTKMEPGTFLAADLAWQIAHARRDPQQIAKTAKDFCALGDPTGRSCVDEEFFGGRIVKGVAVRHGPTEVKLAPSAPFPLTLARIGEVQTGVILDTGASQTVISRALADHLGLALSKKSFPIGVVAGAGVAQAHLAVLPELWIGNTQITTLPVLVVDLPNLDQNAIQVILAPHKDLEGLAVEIDFAADMLRIHEEAPAAGGDDVVVPYLQAGFDLVVPAEVGDGQTALFSFDTGMEQPFAVSREYAGKLPGKGAGKTPSAGSVLYGAGQAKTVEHTGAMPVKLAGRTLSSSGEGILTSIPTGRLFQISGLLGNGLWQDRTVVVDTKRHQIVLAAPKAKAPQIMKASASR